MCIDFVEYKRRKEQENYDIEKEAAELVAWIEEVLQRPIPKLPKVIPFDMLRKSKQQS